MTTKEISSGIINSSNGVIPNNSRAQKDSDAIDTKKHATNEAFKVNLSKKGDTKNEPKEEKTYFKRQGGIKSIGDEFDDLVQFYAKKLIRSAKKMEQRRAKEAQNEENSSSKTIENKPSSFIKKAPNQPVK